MDGGGVRGLSSLLCFRVMMVQINHKFSSFHGDTGELHPHYVFRLMAGTSAGGLIALRLGKMLMTIGESTTQYQPFPRRSLEITLHRDRQAEENLPMGRKGDATAWYVPATPISASFATFEPYESHAIHKEAQGGSYQVVSLSHRYR